MADSGYGVSGPFRDGLAGRLHYIVGVTDEMVVFAEAPLGRTGDGRPAAAPRRLAEGRPGR